MSELDATQFLYSGNQVYIAEMYERFLDDPSSVDLKWQEFFADLEVEARNVSQEIRGASWSPSDAGVLDQGDLATISEQMATGPQAQAQMVPMVSEARMTGVKVREATLDSIRALMLIRAYRVRGHLLAKLDPLGIEIPTEHPELSPATYGFADKDMDREIFINYVLGLETATVREILNILQETYCGSIGVEFMHIQDPDEKSWIQERIERIHNQPHFTEQGKKAILNRLIETEGFEQFLDRKFTGIKRFGLDGGESLVPAMEQIFKRGGQMGIQEIVLGMAHRGRLNVLANVMGKPFQAIFHEFQGGSSSPDDVLPRLVFGPRIRRKVRPPVADGQPVAPGGRQHCLPGQGPRQAGSEERRRPRKGDGLAAARRRRFCRPRPCCPRPSTCRTCSATRPAAPFISLSTTRSASPPIRAIRVRRLIARTWRRSLRHRFSM